MNDISSADSNKGFMSLDEIEYDPSDSTNGSNLPISEVFDQAYDMIKVNLNPENRRHFFQKQQVSNIMQRNLCEFRNETLSLLRQNRTFLEQLFPQIFWFVHLTILDPSKYKDDIVNLQKNIGSAWGKFLFPFEANPSIPTQIRDSFISCIPYFYTQCIQHVYILFMNGNNPSMQKSFRMKICSILVKSFTQVEPLESLLLVNLGFYFKTLPQVDVPPPKEQENMNSDETAISFLPRENLKTLIEMPHRKRPVNTKWNITGLTDLVAESTHRKTVPYEHKSKIVVQYPKDGEQDWTTDLPPLLPDINKVERRLTRANYDPNSETRSLLYRSRRPDILSEYHKMKKDFRMKLFQKNKEVADKKKEINAIEQQLMSQPIIVLKRFSDDLRVLQAERKWNETPYIYSEKDVIRMEEEKLKKLEREKELEQEKKKILIQIKRREREERELQKKMEKNQEEKKKKEKEKTKGKEKQFDHTPSLQMV